MNPRIRSVLIIIGLLTLIVIGIFVIPRGLSLYYQTKGGQHVEYVLRFEEGIQELVCESIPPGNEATREEVEQGIADLNRAIRINKNNAQAYYYLGKANCLLGNLSDARENYLQYAELRPDNPLGYIGLGFVDEKLGDADSSIEAWEAGGLETQDFLEAGDQVFELKQYNNALRWYQRAIKFDPLNGIPWYFIGVVLEELDDLDAAQLAYEEAVSLSPGYLNAYYALGDLSLNKLKDYERAIYFYNKAALLDALPIKANLGIGKSAEGLMNEEEAIVAYSKAKELSDQVIGDNFKYAWLRIWPKYILGDYYLRQGDLTLAKNIFQEAIDEDEEQYFKVWSLWGMGRAALLNNELNLALDLLSQALDFSSNFYLHSQINLALGQTLMEQGEFKTGLEYIKKAHDEHPSNKGLHQYYGELLISTGKFQEAISVLEKYLDRWPDDLEAKITLEELREHQ